MSLDVPSELRFVYTRSQRIKILRAVGVICGRILPCSTYMVKEIFDYLYAFIHAVITSYLAKLRSKSFFL